MSACHFLFMGEGWSQLHTFERQAISELLVLLNHQQHDFLNHLQVISGFLQLGKADRALDYMRTLTLESRVTGELLRLERPQLAAYILILSRKFEKRDVRLITRVELATGKLTTKDDDLAGTVRALSGCLLEYLRKLPPGPKKVELTISHAGGRDAIRLNLPSPGEVFEGFGPNGPEQELQSLAEECGAVVSCHGQGGRVMIEIIFPEPS